MGALGPLKSFVNISAAAYGLFRTPYKAYMDERGGGLLRGLGEGAHDFYNVLVEESNFMIGKYFDAVSKLQGAVDLSGKNF